jgi:hypothetical protein
MGMKRPKGHVAESMDRSRSVETHLGPFKGFRAGKRDMPALGVFKGTRVGRNPDRPQKNIVGVTMPMRGAGKGKA